MRTKMRSYFESLGDGHVTYLERPNGHPWDGLLGWQQIEVQATDQNTLFLAIHRLFDQGLWWRIWLMTDTWAIMYRPTGVYHLWVEHRQFVQPAWTNWWRTKA